MSQAVQSALSTPPAPAPGSPGAAPASSELDEQAFLTLLMTQLAHQDPTSPVETDRFMDQLASLTQVQELIQVNEGLDNLLMGISSLNNETSVGLVGREVTAQGDGFHLGEGENQELHLDLPADAETVSIVIKDADGNMVDVIEAGAMDAGQNSVLWDAQGLNPPPGEGEYSFEVTARDEAGNALEAVELVEGLVQEIRFDSGFPILVVDGYELPLSDVFTVRVPDAPRVAPRAAPGGSTRQSKIDSGS